METLLIHDYLLKDGVAAKMVQALQQAGITLFGAPRAAKMFALPAAESLRREYGNLSMTVALVGSIEEAIDHIHEYGSGHTDSIITEDPVAAKLFLQKV